MTQQEARAGLAFGLCGFALLSCGDAIVKSMGGEWPASAIAALRYTFGAIGLAALVAMREGRAGFVVPRPGLQAVRGLVISVTTFAFFMAVHAMPLANATSIEFTAPAITVVLSAILLNESASRTAWLASVVAFAGVLLVLRPDPATLDLSAGWALLAASGMASLMILNRRAAGTASPLVMQFMISLFAAPILIAAAVVGHLSGWAPMQVGVPDWSVIARCAVVAVTASTAHLLIFMATSRASAAVVAPTIYVQLLVALTLGAVIFGEFPDTVALAGAGLIVFSGLLLWRSQRQIGVRAKRML